MFSEIASIMIHRPVDVVYDFLSHPSNRLKYDPQLSAIRQTPDRPLRIGTQITEVSELEPSGTIGNRTCIGDPMNAFGAYRFEAVPEGARLTLNFAMALQGKMRLVVPFMAGGLKRSIASGLRNIMAVLENHSHHPPHTL